MSEPPVRLCCGKRHYGAQCPDGKVMCCLCFARFPLEKLADADDGRKQDVCLACAEREQEMLKKKARDAGAESGQQNNWNKNDIKE